MKAFIEATQKVNAENIKVEYSPEFDCVYVKGHLMGGNEEEMERW